ncbi:peptidoglycan binding domain-containing protein [[Clostridium] scindens]|uniref:L,D-transpeptidase family protein n=1 Tax=Clostridium scindens (strain JCM 10418 / VPI 12708) TaxID=29347 RepID=UPI003A93F33A
MGDTGKRADEIIEETMKEIYDDLNSSDAFKETDDDYEDSQEEEIDMEDDDSADISADDGVLETDRFDEIDDEDSLEEFDDIKDEELEYDELEDDDMEETDIVKAAKKKKRKKTAAIVAGIIIGVLVLIYVGFAIFFSSHFMFFTKINGTDFSLKSVSQVEAYMKQQVADYVLTLKESDGGSEKISGSDISLVYVPGEQLEKLAKKQNNFLWITSLWNHPKITSEIGVEYDKDAFAKITEGLECLKPENQTVSVDAHPEFQNDKFVVVPEVVGTKIDTEKFNEAVTKAINGFKPTLDLFKTGCYILPRFVSDSQEVVAATDAMNSYLGANVTYDFNPATEVVDASVISQWVTVDADMNVTFNEEAVRAFIQSLADKYDTKGKPRTFTTATGNTVNVTGGSYGWKIDQEAEYNALIANIQNAETVTREPNYASRAASHEGNDVGSTYAEVDLSNQMMYFVQNGQVVLQSGIVTGNPNKGNGTPQGVYSLAYKALDQVLRGTKKPDGTYEYETPVKFWMPFNGGIGFHDATWQSSFGGSRYQTNGSHGCVNLPYDVAAQLYNLITAGTPVVCHY